jgi:lysozyme
MNNNTLLRLLVVDEGWRANPYLCSEGFPTIGYGFKIGPKNADLKNYTFSITKEIGEVWLKEHSSEALKDALLIFPNLANDEVRLAVMASMIYQIGLAGFKKFAKTIYLVQNNATSEASHEMLKSLWASQTPERANRLSKMLKTGIMLAYYESEA